jgi:hypothetical protein
MAMLVVATGFSVGEPESPNNFCRVMGNKKE